jgi:UDP-N-acetylmuramoylalanine--D-glutamate ligase
MIPVPGFRDKTVFVFGLARSGLAAAKALQAGGARALCWDDKAESRAAAEKLGLMLQEPEAADWSLIAALVLAPGVPLTHPKPHPVVDLARAADVEVIGDTELFFRALKPSGAKIVAITGTNGKSTTTALIGHLLSRMGYATEVGGNIGRAVLEMAPPSAGRAYVLELSSFQLDLTPSCHPDVAVLLNITPDHLDRHGTMERYAAAKETIFARQVRGDTAVIGVDDTYSAGICTQVMGRAGPHVSPVSVGKALGRGIYVIEGRLYDGEGATTRDIRDLKTLTHLPGAHNWQNAAAAFAACMPLVKDAKELASHLTTFPGLEHRMEQVGRIGKVLFVNDSKATNADAASKALASYKDIFWIAGGKSKDGGAAGLEAYKDHVAAAYLIGASAAQFQQQLSGAMKTTVDGTLEAAMRNALRDAMASSAAAPVVMLSPACASFDQFKDFEHRGAEFKRLFTVLAEDIRLQGAA